MNHPDGAQFEALPLAGRVGRGHRAYRREAWLYLSVLALIIALGGGWIPLVRFASERIVVTVEPQALRVEGFYSYTNPWPLPLTQGLAVPTPLGEGLAPAEGLAAALVPARPGEAEQPLPLGSAFGTPRLQLLVPANGRSTLVVRYRQRHDGARARYLLTTTAAWGRPLARGRYELVMPAGALRASTYPLRWDGDRYTFERTGFMPPADWAFRFYFPGVSR